MLSAGLILFLAALQGVTELFPVSSLGHAVVVPPLIGLNFQRDQPRVRAGARRAAPRDRRRRCSSSTAATGCGSSPGSSAPRCAGVSTIPISASRSCWSSGPSPPGSSASSCRTRSSRCSVIPRLASAFLIVNGGILFAAEMFRRRDERRRRRRASAPVLAHEDGRSRLSADRGTEPAHRGDRRLLPGGRAPAGHLALRDHHGRRARGRPAPRGGGTILVPARDPDHPRGRAARGARASAPTRRPCWWPSAPPSWPGSWRMPAPVSCFATFAQDVSTPSRITVRLSGPQASSSSTDGRELTC